MSDDEEVLESLEPPSPQHCWLALVKSLQGHLFRLFPLFLSSILGVHTAHVTGRDVLTLGQDESPVFQWDVIADEGLGSGWRRRFPGCQQGTSLAACRTFDFSCSCS